MSDEKNVANLYPYQDKNKYGEDYFKWNKKDRKKLIKKTFREIAGQSNAEKSDEKGLDEERKSIEFKCSICNLAEICHYFGKCPPFARGQIEYVDDSFVMMDPFTPRDKGDLWIYETNNKLQRKTSIFF